MIRTTTISLSRGLISKARDYAELTKMRLSALVVFTSVMSYLLAAQGAVYWWNVLALALGGFLVTGAAGALNQVFEKDSDRLMDRTKDRPVAAGRMNAAEAMVSAGFMGISGIALLTFAFNPLSGALGALSLLTYVFIYTPFKKVSPFAVFVGAFPGAMPLLIGWTSFTGTLTTEAFVLFGIQFFWQLPHFWAIAWLAHDDYRKGGFQLLPDAEGKTRSAALQNLPYLFMLLLVSTLPYILGLTGMWSLIILIITGAYFLHCGIQLAIDLQDRSARKLMFASFLYLPVVLISLVIDKI